MKRPIALCGSRPFFLCIHALRLNAGHCRPAQRFVDEVVTIAAMHSTSPESTQRTLRFMALAAFSSMASMRVCDPMLPALSQ